MDSLTHYKQAISHHSAGELIQANHYYQLALTEQAQRQQTFYQTIQINPIDTDLLEHHLWQVLTGFYHNQIQAFMTGGSLLGITRQGSILKTDKDIDIALPYSQLDAAGKWLQQHGWTRKINMPQLLNPQEWQHESGIYLDLVGYEAQENHWIAGFWYESSQHPWSRVTRLSPITLIEKNHPQGNYYHPEAPEQLLNQLFGEDWQIPNQHYDSLLNPNFIHELSLITRCYALKRIYWHWLSKSYNKAISLIEGCLVFCPNDTFFTGLLNSIRQQQAQHKQQL